MVTIVALPGEGNAVPGALLVMSEDVSPSRGVCGRHPHRHRHGHGRHGSSPTRVGRRPHHHHHHRHHCGPFSHAKKHGHGDLYHSGLMHHGGFHRGPRGRHFFRGMHEIGGHGHGLHGHGRRRHRSLSPRHLFHHRSSECSLGSPNRGHRDHEGRGFVDGASCQVCEHHVFHQSQERNPGPQVGHFPQQPAAIEHGIEQLQQLSLASSSTS